MVFSSTRGNNIFDIKLGTFWLNNFVNINLKIKDNFQPGTCNIDPLLRNLGY